MQNGETKSHSYSAVSSCCVYRRNKCSQVSAAEKRPGVRTEKGMESRKKRASSSFPRQKNATDAAGEQAGNRKKRSRMI